MKKLVLAVTLALAATAAQADITSGAFTLTSGSGGVFNQGFLANQAVVPSPGDDGWGGNGSTLNPAGLYTEGSFGMLTVNTATQVQFTFLGKVAAFTNGATDVSGFVNGVEIDDSTSGASRTSTVTYAAGDRIVFGFTSVNPLGISGAIRNGMANVGPFGIMYFDAAAWNQANNSDYAFLIGYNDPSDGNADYDDYVMGVKAVPVPAALPLMASALGMFGIARRRKNAAK